MHGVCDAARIRSFGRTCAAQVLQLRGDAALEWACDDSLGPQGVLRPARSGDRAALTRFFERVSSEDLYFRFLFGTRKIDDARLEAMLRDNDDQSIDFLALDVTSGEILATAMLVADRTFDTAEFCALHLSRSQGTLIELGVARSHRAICRGHGHCRLVSLQSASHTDALQLKREKGFSVRNLPEDPTLAVAERMFR